MVVIDLAAVRKRRAQQQHGGAKVVGRQTVIVDPADYQSCACGHTMKGRSVIIRNDEGFIRHCPGCLQNPKHSSYWRHNER